jgi:hypothetical protein
MVVDNEKHYLTANACVMCKLFNSNRKIIITAPLQRNI